jgi:hypothetical protein
MSMVLRRIVHLQLTAHNFSEKLLTLAWVNSIGLTSVSRRGMVLRLFWRFSRLFDWFSSSRYLCFEVVPHLIEVGSLSTVSRTSRTGWRKVSLVLVHLIIQALLVLRFFNRLPFRSLDITSSKLGLTSSLEQFTEHRHGLFLVHLRNDFRAGIYLSAFCIATVLYSSVMCGSMLGSSPSD